MNNLKGFRFKKEIQIAPWLRLNLSKSGISASVGPRGAHVNVGKNGSFLNLDLPGTGAYYRTKIDNKGLPEILGSAPAKEPATKAPKTTAKESTDKRDAKQVEMAPPKLDIGFWERITAPSSELDLKEAMKALSLGDEETAYKRAREAANTADGAFLAGFLALRQQDYLEAEKYLNAALQMRQELGAHFNKYGIDAIVELPITQDISTEIGPDVRGVLLALVDVEQQLGKPDAAVHMLEQLHEMDPEDLMIRLRLAEMYDTLYPDSEEMQKRIIELAEDVSNLSPIHAGLMLYRARALRKLGLIDAATDTLTRALRKKTDYPRDLLHALRYERAVILEATGDEKRAHAEFEKIYAEAPNFEDVAAKIGL